tara:strand:+ start:13555 stop:13794 length:240 start_codon:yes stop_codon:yes gene_type:complete
MGLRFFISMILRNTNIQSLLNTVNKGQMHELKMDFSVKNMDGFGYFKKIRENGILPHINNQSLNSTADSKTYKRVKRTY